MRIALNLEPDRERFVDAHSRIFRVPWSACRLGGLLLAYLATVAPTRTSFLAGVLVIAGLMLFTYPTYARRGVRRMQSRLEDEPSMVVITGERIHAVSASATVVNAWDLI